MKRASSSSSSNSARWASGTFARSASRRCCEVALAIRRVRGAEDGAHQHLGHLERVLVGDVVARDEAVARLRRGTPAAARRCPAVAFRSSRTCCAGRPRTLLGGDAARGEGGPQAFERPGADAARDWRRALEHAEHFTRRQARPALHFRHEVAHGKAARNREDVMPVDHLDHVGPDLVEVGEELRVAERRDGRVLDPAIPRDRIRLVSPRPSAACPRARASCAKTPGAAAMRRRISGCSRVSSMKIGRGGGPDALVRRSDRARTSCSRSR